MITVYEIAVTRMIGKEQALPPISEQWPARDRTKTPDAKLPGQAVGEMRCNSWEVINHN